MTLSDMFKDLLKFWLRNHNTLEEKPTKKLSKQDQDLTKNT